MDSATFKCRLGAKFDEIAERLAHDLGYGSVAQMDDKQRERHLNETEETIEQWQETVEMAPQPMSPVTPLQTLFREYSDIEDDYMARMMSGDFDHEKDEDESQ